MSDSATEKELAFDLVEYQERLERVRSIMRQRGLDVLLTHTPENILYLSGYQTAGSYMYHCLVVPLEGQPILILRRAELGNFLRFCYLRESVTYTDIQDPAELTAKTLADRGLARGRIGLELGSWFLTPKRYLALQSALGSATVVDATGTIERCRLVKSTREVDHIRRAARAVEAGMQGALDAIRDGVVDDVVAAELHRALFRAGSEYVALSPFVAAGYKSTIMHGNWGRKRIERGESVILEIGGCIQRYHAALMRTVSVGPPAHRLRDMAKASEEANRVACEAIRPGVTSGEVHRACQLVFEKAGLIDLRRGNRSGYSIGLAFPPDWGEGHILSLQDNDPTVLEPGMVFHVLAAVREYGLFGASFSETVLVTPTGHELLTRFERVLFVRE
ncbi:MAG: aminopeptidase P family protein [Acidobacteria bacterium]|nr:aminopeptidase P family protein [Acidobacteriota bacterium]